MQVVTESTSRAVKDKEKPHIKGRKVVCGTMRRNDAVAEKLNFKVKVLM